MGKEAVVFFLCRKNKKNMETMQVMEGENCRLPCLRGCKRSKSGGFCTNECFSPDNNTYFSLGKLWRWLFLSQF